MDDLSDVEVLDWSFMSDDSTAERSLCTKLHNILVDKVFIGEYVERHYVDSLATYRDLIIVDSDDDVRQFFQMCIQLTKMESKDKKWLGITTDSYDGTPAGYCLWVELSPVPLGKYWFKIESVKCTFNEITPRLKPLKVVKNSESPAKRTSPETLTSSMDLLNNFDLQTFFDEFQWADVPKFGSTMFLEVSTGCIQNIKRIMTYENIRETIRFSSILILTLISFLFETSRYLCDYSLKMMNELSKLIRAMTPIVMGIIEFSTKCVGGFYLLILMLWRGSSGPPIPANALPAAFQRNSRQAIKYEPSYGSENIYARRRPQPRGRFAQY